MNSTSTFDGRMEFLEHTSSSVAITVTFVGGFKRNLKGALAHILRCKDANYAKGCYKYKSLFDHYAEYSDSLCTVVSMDTEESVFQRAKTTNHFGQNETFEDRVESTKPNHHFGGELQAGQLVRLPLDTNTGNQKLIETCTLGDANTSSAKLVESQNMDSILGNSGETYDATEDTQIEIKENLSVEPDELANAAICSEPANEIQLGFPMVEISNVGNAESSASPDVVETRIGTPLSVEPDELANIKVGQHCQYSRSRAIQVYLALRKRSLKMAGVGQGEASRQGRELEIEVHAVEANGDGPPAVAEKHISLARLVFACMVAGGVQYGWALQLSLPMSRFCGLWSDRCQSRFGRRRPFIFVECILITIAVSNLAIKQLGFDNDVFIMVLDGLQQVLQREIVRFNIINMYNFNLQGPARALMADLSSHHGPNTANAIFGSWKAIGNILGYLSGSSGIWHKWFPFLMTHACCEACANLKGAFLVAEVLLFISLTVTLFLAKEIRLCDLNKFVSVDQQKTSFFDVFSAFKNLPPGMRSVLLVTALTWLSWFPFILYNTDWMGREIYYGNPKGTNEQSDAYDRGVRDGALGLLLNSVVLAISSFLIAPMCRKLGTKIVWAISNLTMFVCMVAICIIGIWSSKEFHFSAQSRLTVDPTIRIIVLALFTILGFPLAVVYSVPFAVTAQLTANVKGGQGLCAGILNNSIVIPQVIVALGAGPWDALFGKGNMPAFALASAIAFLCSIVGLLTLP
ncbi:hypothetical protein ZIOFF_023353 [Zingiber officinale]|uniref:Uncharacterized protein n=1 Tax=Zingiber officinale TaxID=94328 RepID=A0A8J5LCE9_ZINOF|nr:hypothetical protein ZIOFF_023353 [Zingiber officinale]